jgi:hypothetical protein
MSPAEADSTETKEATEGEPVAEADAGERKDRLAFIGKAGDSMGKIPVVNKIPRSMRLIAVLLVLVIIIAVIAVALPGGKKTDNGGPSTINPDKLEDWKWGEQVFSGNLNEGSSSVLLIDDIVDKDATIFVKSIQATLTWTDEPDGNIGPRQKENEPDTFQLEINGTEGMSIISVETSNTHGSSGTIIVSVDAESAGYSYLVLGNVSDAKLPDDVVIGSLEVIVYMIVAGDHHSPPPEFVYINDFGNDYELTLTAEGKTLPAK